ncbi:MAG TPA: peptidoglycan DD-metalloendopeptidase family protein [Syntrophorhabdales bacterium]|nr:peptidoglycan DD-metalloendopeptidase family protein [Syntrophorhabdales bacterium]
MDRLPSLPEFARRTRFTEHMVLANGLGGSFAEWLFLPGMLFNGRDKWWGRRGRRVAPHEGLDFCLYEDGDGRVLRLGAGSRVPAMYDGTVAGIVDDFLGETIVMEHRFPEAPTFQLITVYGHTLTARGLQPGSEFRAGDIIAFIASHRDTGVDPHLHVSLGRPSGLLAHKSLNWQNMKEGLVMFDPIGAVDGPLRVYSPA